MTYSENVKKNTRTGLEVAIIGMTGRFPGARNIHEYWENLKNGVESISFFTDEELEKAGIAQELINNPAYIKASGVIENAEYFDAYFFGYTPNEAEIMNPEMRFFHECAWEALEDAGYNPGSYDGLIGVYAGASSSFFWEGIAFLSGKTKEIGDFAAGNLTCTDFLTTMISYKFNLKGPSAFIKTACSTSLVAIHWACRAVLSGECQMALAGGVTLDAQKQGYIYEEGMISSPDGHCRAFSAEARGTVGGNGIGIVVLKRLKNAIADRDHIYAIIKGSAINNDGNRKVGYTAPSVLGQAEAIRTAQAMAHVEPGSIGYIETHGTGTTLGDPVEIEALTLAFNTGKRNYCPIGSVKTNIGHLDTAAGVAGLIKTVLALNHRLIPPSLHCQTPNPKIDFKNSPFFVNTRLMEWKSNGGPRLAGVSSFGIGGTNAHVVLEEAPVLEVSPGIRTFPPLLLSAKTQPALDRMTDNLITHLKDNPGINFSDAVYTLAIGRKHFKHRKLTICSSREEAIEVLASPGAGKVQVSILKTETPQVVFMFPGQGSQYIDMGLDLYQTEPVFRREMDRCFDILKPLIKDDIKEVLYPSLNERQYGLPGSKPSTGDNERINHTEMTQVVIFIFEYALAKLLLELGIEPYGMIGHSIGEYTAACLSGVFSLEDALKIVVMRGKLMQKMPAGAMLSVPLPEEELKSLMDEKISLAAVNSTSHCVISGENSAVDSFKNKLQEIDCESSLLHTSHAFHSYMMDPILTDFEKTVKCMEFKKPGIPYLSNVTGDWITANDITDMGYWARHLRGTVRFSLGLEKLLKEESTIFVEVGPGKSLSTFVSQHKNKKDHHSIVNLIRHPKEEVSDHDYFLNKMGLLWLYGKNIDWKQLFPGESFSRIPLPTYPFESQPYRLEQKNIKNDFEALYQQQKLQKKKNISDWLYAPTWSCSQPSPFHQKDIFDAPGWMVFVDESGLGILLAERLKNMGKVVVSVNAGPGFFKISDTQYTLNPSQRDDYTALFRELANHGKIPRNIFHLWSFSTPPIEEYTIEEFNRSQYNGFFSLLYLAQALEKSNVEDNIEIIVITGNMQEVTGREALQPEKATVLSPVMVIPQEYPHIKCRSIDILPLTPDNTREVINRLLTEFSIDSADNFVAYRDNHRWIKTYEPIPVKENLPVSSPLKEKGVYLITGGLGKIGLVLAEHLAKAVQARLVLTGHSEFPEKDQWEHWLNSNREDEPISRKIMKLKRLEELGAQVLVFKADAADQQQMQQVITRAEQHLGPINGVIHAAVFDATLFTAVKDTDPGVSQTQFHPKVAGLLVLEKVLQGKKIDFCLLMSSLSAVLGGLGFAAYAAANLFMDSFILRHNRVNPVGWTSIDWDGWLFIDKKEAAPGGLFMLPEEGVEVLERILSWNKATQFVVSTGDLKGRVFNQSKIGSLPQSSVTTKPELLTYQQRGILSISYEPPQNPLEQKLVDIFESFFMIKPVGIYDDFYELGGDSLRAVQLTGLIKKLGSGIKISIHEVLLYRNIHDIGACLGKKDGIGMMENIVNPSPSVSEEKKLPLKDEVSPEEQRLMEKKLEEIDRLSGLLKDNKRIRSYEISPVQASWLTPLNPRIPTSFLYYVHDFSYPIDYEKISDFVKTLTQRNSLLRSVIINEKGNYFIEEFDAFLNIQLPLIDLSSYSDACRETIIDRLISYLNKPMEIFDHVLFRPWVLKLDHAHFRLFLQLNHLIFDGTSFGVLDEQLHSLKHGIEGTQKKSTPTDYYDYVQFMKKQNYDHTGLDQYVNPKDYFHTNNVILKKYEMANMQYESFEVDISGISAKFKDYYNEIAFLAFAKLIGDLFGVDKVPIRYITNGRYYEGGDFNHIIGDFHDMIPVLIDLLTDPKTEIDRFVAYNRFIKKNKLNFMNYMQKGYIPGLDLETETLRSPFSFNAIIGSYDFLKKSFNERLMAAVKFTSPHFDMLLLEDFSADKLWITFSQNSIFTIKEIFMRNYSQLVNYLNETTRGKGSKYTTLHEKNKELK